MVIQDTLDNLYQFIARSQSESLFPQPGSLVADDEDVNVVILVAHLLP